MFVVIWKDGHICVNNSLMAKRVSYLLIVFAFLIALSHSMVPHCHNNFSAQTTVQLSEQAPPNTFLAFLRTVFSVDLGLNHLQDYRGQDHSPDPLLLTAVFVFSLFEFTLGQPAVSNEFSTVQPVLLATTDAILTAKPLRAPPQV